MPDPFANLATVADFGFGDPADVIAELCQPFDDQPDFDAGTNPEIQPNLHMTADRAFIRRPVRRLFIDYRPNPAALTHLETLPAEGESLHGIICGRYALWDIVPALIERTGSNIIDLHLLTLGFSKANGADLCGLLDDGRVGRVALICSHYFAKTSEAIYSVVVPELLNRGQRVLAFRTHAKLILAQMADGSRFVVESSANLRSCVNVEQFVLSRAADLYDFHRSWVEGELLSRCRKVSPDEAP